MKFYKAYVASNATKNIDDFASIRCEWQEVAIPSSLPEGEVQIKVSYSSLNYKDALAVTGRGKILRALPLSPGIDASGTVIATRSSKFKEGDSVVVTGCGLGESRNGGLGEIITVPESWVIPLPVNLNLKTAALLGTAGFTAALALHQLEKNDLTPSQGKVLVTGATGGVGSLSLLMLKKRGYQTVAWSRKTESHPILKKWGADEIENPLKVGKSRPLESAKWASAIDNVGGEILANILPSVQPHGSVASIGLAQSPELKTTVFPFILRGVNILGISSATCPRPLREKIWDLINSLACDWESVKTSDIGTEQVEMACLRIIQGTVHGRTLVHLNKENI